MYPIQAQGIFKMDEHYKKALFVKQSGNAVKLEQAKFTEDFPLKASEDYLTRNRIASFQSPETKQYTRIEYLNETNTTLYVVDHMGARREVPPFGRRHEKKYSSHVIEGHFVIRYSFTYHLDEAKGISEYFRRLAGDNAVFEALSRIDATKNDDLLHTGSSTRVARVTIRISHKHIDGPIPCFLEEFGILIGNTANYKVMANPVNQAELYNLRCAYMDHGVSRKDDPAFLRVRAYSNKENLYECLYMKIADHVQEIPVLYDPTGSRHGVEIFAKAKIDESGHEVKEGPVVYPFDEAFKLFDLHTTITGAMAVKETRLKDLHTEEKLREQQIKIDQLELAKEKLEAERLKMENDKQEAEEKYRRESERHEREHRHNYERAQMDVLKTAIGLLVTVVGGAIAIIKLMPKPA